MKYKKKYKYTPLEKASYFTGINHGLLVKYRNYIDKGNTDLSYKNGFKKASSILLTDADAIESFSIIDENIRDFNSFKLKGLENGYKAMYDKANFNLASNDILFDLSIPYNSKVFELMVDRVKRKDKFK